MAVLEFSLSPEATGRIFELLVCLAKFGDAVSIEARSEKLTLTALNLSHTAYASFALDARVFFASYDFNAISSAKGGDRFTCQLLNKALQSVFRGRTSDARGRETPIERCEVSIQDQLDQTECRLVVRLVSKHGVTKTHRLTYESKAVVHALFDETSATQGWQISARVLREYIEYFGPKTEQLDIVASEGKVTFTSFTEKVQDGKEVLKQPLETAIAIHTDDFEDFHMQENLHIVINVKDFRAIVTHAETLRGSLSARFSRPARPLQFHYQSFGLHCEFTLMTTGDHREASTTPTANFVSTRTSLAPPSISRARDTTTVPSEMPPPSRLSSNLSFSQSQRPSSGDQTHRRAEKEPEHDPDSLFMPLAKGDEDQGWDPATYDQNEEDEMLGWDADNDDLNAPLRRTFRDGATSAMSSRPSQPAGHGSDEGLEPTQRLSELHGMFD